MKAIIVHIKYRLIFLTFGMCLGCNDILELAPYGVISDKTFWRDEKDALMALTGVYNNIGGSGEEDFFSAGFILYGDQKSDNAFASQGVREFIVDGQLNPDNPIVGRTWNVSYRRIARANFFLDNIDKVINMDESVKNGMKAEARFIRAAYYFYMSQYWGGVPLVQKVLTVSEANSVTIDTKETVVDFVLKEMGEVADILPATRPDAERGRVTQAAALAFKGRLLMAEKRWAEAAVVYKSIIDLGIYIIDPSYQDIFLEKGERSNEIIYSVQYLNPNDGNNNPYRYNTFSMSGQSQVTPLNDLVQAYECTDGKTIDESPLYDPQNPYVKAGVKYRDPRLYFTILLPNVSTLVGDKLYITHPDSTNSKDALPKNSWTGYGLLKFIDYSYTGDLSAYGGDVPLVRYAEVLLSYLESKLESGDPITQDLLDQTINKVRARESVNMPPVSETDRDKLRTILRRERRIELAMEGIRTWDIYRWGIAETVLNRKIYGSKVADGPGGKYTSDQNGYYYVYERRFKTHNYLWPIPQSERDINSKLGQNPGY